MIFTISLNYLTISLYAPSEIIGIIEIIGQLSQYSQYITISENIENIEDHNELLSESL